MPVITRPGSDGDGAERWAVDAGAADIATLDISPSAHRRRVFAIDVRFVVRASATGPAAWQALSVELDGVREWSRRIDTHGQTDALDYHCRRVLEIGQALRVRAVTKLGGAQRLRLLIEAEEQPTR
ncbi:MAG: hypothetical protein Q8M01_18790 [Rubrivivax sp.]|nr:hypothetical protein [Rubrivivax sp.]